MDTSDLISFDTVQSALRFLTNALDAGQHERIADACLRKRFDELLDHDSRLRLGLKSSREYRLEAIQALAELHRRQPLAPAPHVERFPEDQDSLTLEFRGERTPETLATGEYFFGIDVDFIREEGSWCLREVCCCR